MYSREHKQFLKKIKREKLIVRSIQILILLLFLFLWQLAASKGWINSFITSSPKEVINTLIKLSNDNLFEHIWVTIYETFIITKLNSFISSPGTIIGIFIATILWWNRYLFKIFDPYLTILNSLPKVALGPIIIIWCGSGIKSIIIMALLISVIITIINISVCFNSVDSNKIKLLKSFQATKNQLFFKLIFPSSITSIVSSLKINISMSLIGVIMGEFLVSKKGIGYLILYGSQTFNLNLVMTGIIVLCIVAALMYYIVLYLEKKLNK